MVVMDLLKPLWLFDNHLQRQLCQNPARMKVQWLGWLPRLPFPPLKTWAEYSVKQTPLPTPCYRTKWHQCLLFNPLGTLLHQSLLYTSHQEEVTTKHMIWSRTLCCLAVVELPCTPSKPHMLSVLSDSEGNLEELLWSYFSWTK